MASTDLNAQCPRDVLNGESGEAVIVVPFAWDMFVHYFQATLNVKENACCCFQRAIQGRNR